MTNTCKTNKQILYHKFIFKIASFILGSFQKQIKKYDDILMALDCGSGNYVVNFQAPNIVYKSEWFDETVDLDFDGMKYKAPKDYEKILSAYYGNYMQLPPIEKRKSHHIFKAYYRE